MSHDHDLSVKSVLPQQIVERGLFQHDELAVAIVRRLAVDLDICFPPTVFEFITQEDFAGAEGGKVFLGRDTAGFVHTTEQQLYVVVVDDLQRVIVLTHDILVAMTGVPHQCPASFQGTEYFVYLRLF